MIRVYVNPNDIEVTPISELPQLSSSNFDVLVYAGNTAVLMSKSAFEEILAADGCCFSNRIIDTETENGSIEINLDNCRNGDVYIAREAIYKIKVSGSQNSRFSVFFLSSGSEIEVQGLNILVNTSATEPDTYYIAEFTTIKTENIDKVIVNFTQLSQL